MKQQSLWAVIALVLLVGSISFGAFFSQQQETRVRQRERELAVTNLDELARLQRENRRLKDQQLDPVELQALREDHAAVVRLRKEVEDLQQSAESRKRAMATAQAQMRHPFEQPVGSSAPADVFTLKAGKGEGVLLQGVAVDAARLRSRLEALPRGSRFEIRVQVPKTETAAERAALKAGIDQTIKMSGEVAKDLGLSMSVKTESGEP